MPFRSMIRDRMSGALVQAWPQLERELLEVGRRHTENQGRCEPPQKALRFAHEREGHNSQRDLAAAYLRLS